jgi:hypothetical protein
MSAKGRWEGAAPIAQIGKSINQIALLRLIHNWSPNGIQQGTVNCDLNSSLLAAESEYGGSVQQRMTMNGRPQ